MNNIIKIVLVILVIMWMSVIFIFSGQEGPKSTVTSQGVIKVIINTIPTTKDLTDKEKKELVEKWKKPIRKIAHFSIYLLGGILIYLVINLFKIQIGLKILFAQMIGTLYAITDEVHQLFIPGRSGQALDVCIDSLGILVGILIAVLFIQRYKRIKEKDVLV